ncbi:unnamed protein product [Sphenostylis stenocarpa]|uniref:SKA complex subunit 1 homolog n=1 Tax=Sphenostylis stenocarpa TaxID=92480 RepID=A0AA86VIN0_9FABA|nr:unnamed protein product [Sphenostylis stenocarpa]
MDGNKAGASLDSLMSSFNARITQLQELVIARNMYPASAIADLSAVDAAVSAMELQQKKLQNMSLHVPSQMADRMTVLHSETSRCLFPEYSGSLEALKLDQEPAAVPKEKKGRGSPPTWYVTGSELDSLSSYMRGRLTLEKVNAAINDMVSYAESNSQLIVAPKKKLAENLWEKALEIRDIATMEGIKGKHFFLEADIKGPSLKLDNTGKAILTVLRHLGRINETRVGHNRVIILQKPH